MEIKIENFKPQRPLPVRGNFLDEIELIQIKFQEQNYRFLTIEGLHQLSTDEKVDQIKSFLSGNVSIENIHPEVEFIIESHRQTFKSISVHFNYLYQNDTIQNYKDCLKIKITPATQADELKLIFKNPLIKMVRLDGNQKLDEVQLENILGQFSNEELQKIEYIEEPTRDIRAAKNILDKFNIKIAVDESYTENIEKDFSFFVLKPSLIGFSQSKKIIERLALLNKKTIISSSFDISKGMDALIYLSDYSNQQTKSSLHTPDYHGLDTFKYFPSHFFNFKCQENKLSL